MYSYADRIRAVEFYIKLGKRVRSKANKLATPIAVNVALSRPVASTLTNGNKSLWHLTPMSLNLLPTSLGLFDGLRVAPSSS